MAKRFTFGAYDVGDAKRAGCAFLQAFHAVRGKLVACKETHHWTEATLDWFANAAADGVVVDASPASRLTRDRFVGGVFHNDLDKIAPASPARRGASLLDLAHHRLRSYDHYHERVGYWREAYAGKLQDDLKNAPEMLLGLESEAGKQGNESLNTHRVMEDASKLLPFAARIKVVVFGSNGPDERKTVQELAGLLAGADYTKTRAGLPPAWLWLDLPWPERWNKEHGLAGWIDVPGGPRQHISLNGQG